MRCWVFSPEMERTESLTEESKSFLQRFFGAQPIPLIAHLVENDMLSSEEIEQLRTLIDERKTNDIGRQDS